MATKSLYVGNLSYSATEEALIAYFAPYGAKSARIVQGRGFGFVDIDADQLDAAIAERHNSRLDGRTLTVNEAKPREQHPQRPSSSAGGGRPAKGGWGDRDDDRGGGGKGGKHGGGKRRSF